MHARQMNRLALEETRECVHLPKQVILLFTAMLQSKPRVLLASFLQVPITKKSTYENCFLISCQTYLLHITLILTFPTSHGIIHFAMGFHRYKPFLYPRITPREDNGPLFQGLSPG